MNRINLNRIILESDHFESDHFESDHFESDHFESDHFESDHFESDHFESDHFESDYVPSHTVEGSRFKALYADFTGEHLDLKGNGKLANLLARCEAAGVCWLEFRQENPRHLPILFVHGHSSSSVRGASASRGAAKGLSSAVASPIFEHSQREPARVSPPTREGCCLSGWVEVTTAGLAPPEPEATGLEASLSQEDALERARQTEEDEAFVRELQKSPSQEDGVLDKTVQIKENEEFAQELAGGEDENEGRDVSLPSATSSLSPTSGRCGGGEDTASCDECAICMDQLRCLDICLWPCRHRHFCRDCADTLVSQPCPICRCPVTEVLSLY